ncbi:MAG: hypothetical protein K6T26_08025, partial [Alicyclobacillus sp.]|nr:hypothetical protein [Alicyclobacillus sp.]
MPITWKIALGLEAGTLGVVLMAYSLHLSGDTITDLRHLPVIVIAAYVGAWASIPAACIIAGGRILMFGLSPTALWAAWHMLVIGVVSPWLAPRVRTMARRVFVLNLYALTEISYNLWMSVPDKHTLWPLLLLFWMLSL